jgi:phosphatidylserine decarboxylase
VFAPPAGRYLGICAFLLLAGLALWSVDLIPRDLPVLSLLLLSLAGIVALLVFFRDPERRPGPDIVAPADGRVRAVDRDATALRISVFMNVTDVHVNRFPLDGRVDRIDDEGSGFRPAYLEDSRHNVRRHYHLATAIGGVEVIQMTGIVARRLVSYVAVGDARAKGDRLGMIALGSRVDVLLPAARAEPLVAVGDRVVAGVTPIARGHP